MKKYWSNANDPGDNCPACGTLCQRLPKQVAYICQTDALMWHYPTLGGARPIWLWGISPTADTSETAHHALSDAYETLFKGWPSRQTSPHYKLLLPLREGEEFRPASPVVSHAPPE